MGHVFALFCFNILCALLNLKNERVHPIPTNLYELKEKLSNSENYIEHSAWVAYLLYFV